jgi:hypothetical protein
MVSRSRLSVVGELLIAAVDRIFNEPPNVRVGVGLGRLRTGSIRKRRTKNCNERVMGLYAV